MKFILSIVILILILFVSFPTTSLAKSFNDNFDDGHTNKWWLGYSLAFPSMYGNWRIENGSLVQDTGYDGVLTLIEDEEFNTQTVEVDTKLNGPSGGNGITLWFKDNYNGIHLTLSNGKLGVGEVVDNSWTTYDFPLSYNINENRWVNLRVEADSDSGVIKVYMDGNYQFTYNAVTTDRYGQTGFNSGNAGGYFDNFRLKSKLR